MMQSTCYGGGGGGGGHGPLTFCPEIYSIMNCFLHISFIVLHKYKNLTFIAALAEYSIVNAQ